MSKDSISREYLNITKHKYLSGPYGPPARRRTLVVGTKQGNIGYEIWQVLDYQGHTVEAIEHTDCDAADLETLVELERYDTIIFNNGETHLDWIEDQPSWKIHDVVYNSLTATMVGTSQFVKHTLNKPYKKHIVFIGSMAYKNVLNGSAPYCAAKAGLAMFTRCMAWELAPKNYDVFCVHPSNVENSPMSEETVLGLMRFRGLSRQEAEEYWSASLPRSNWLQKGDIADTVSYVVSGEAAYMSGTNIDLAGGQR